MTYDEARADLDDLALEMTKSNHSWSYTQRLDKLRALAILTRRALKSASGLQNEDACRNDIETILNRIKRMMESDAQLDHLKSCYKLH